jgi:short-subunit dehydrogenase
MSSEFADRYGPWALVAGGSDGIRAGIARGLAVRGVNLAEGLWAEWRGRGVDVLNLVVTATDTPSLQRVLQAQGGSYGGLAAPDDVAANALDHLADRATWMCAADDPLGPPPFGMMPRRKAVLQLSGRAMGDEGR